MGSRVEQPRRTSGIAPPALTPSLGSGAGSRAAAPNATLVPGTICHTGDAAYLTGSSFQPRRAGRRSSSGSRTELPASRTKQPSSSRPSPDAQSNMHTAFFSHDATKDSREAAVSRSLLNYSAPSGVDPPEVPRLPLEGLAGVTRPFDRPRRPLSASIPRRDFHCLMGDCPDGTDGVPALRRAACEPGELAETRASAETSSVPDRVAAVGPAGLDLGPDRPPGRSARLPVRRTNTNNAPYPQITHLSQTRARFPFFYT